MKAAIGRHDITPSLGTPCALGLDDECEQVFDPPHVRVLALQEGDVTVLLLAADVIGLQRRNQLDLKGDISAATGVPPERIFLHGTHTHQSPTVQVANNVPLEPYGLHFADPGYYAQFRRACVRAAKEALTGLMPVTASWGQGEVRGVASNRRIVDADGTLHWRSSRPSAAMRALPEGEIDPFVRVLRLAEVGGPRELLLLSYCCHPSSSGGDEEHYATADFPGAAMARLEHEHPDRRCIYFTGPCGDINPGKHVGEGTAPEDRIRDLQLLGRRLADGVEAALAQLEPIDDGELLCGTATARTLVRPEVPSIAELEQALADAVAVYRAAKAEGKRLPGGGDVRRLAHRLQMRAVTEDGALVSEVSALRWGLFACVFLPGECFLAMAQDLWRRYPGLHLIPVAPADYTLSYVPTPQTYEQGGYEAQVANVGPEAYGLLLEAATGLLDELTAG